LVLVDGCPDLIGAREGRAATLHQRKAGIRICFACPLARSRHASGIGGGGRAGCRANGELLFEVEAERRDQVRAGDQGVVVDGLADRGLERSGRAAFAAVFPARGHCFKVHVTVQDGIDVDEVRLPAGNLVTGAVCDAKPVQCAGRGWPRSGVVAKRDCGTFAFQKVRRLHRYVGPRGAIRGRRKRVEFEGLVLSKPLEIKGRAGGGLGGGGRLIRAITPASKRQQAKQANHRGPSIPFIDLFHDLAPWRLAFSCRRPNASEATADADKHSCGIELRAAAVAGGRFVQPILSALAGTTVA
jgi:hypothetical protein